MWINIHYKQNTLTGLEKIFLEGNNYKGPSSFQTLELTDSESSALIDCATLLVNNFGEEVFFKIILDFIVYFDEVRHILTCPIPPLAP